MAISGAELGYINTAVSGLSNYMLGRTQAKMKEAAQAHSNAMRRINTAQQQNTVTLQEAAIQDESTRMGTALQGQAIRDRGAAEVSAAAAGVAGGSVDQAILGLRRSAIQAQDARMQNMTAQLYATEQQRKNIRIAGVLGQDVSVIPRPSASAALLGLGTQLLGQWDDNQPKGSKIADGNTPSFNWFKGK
jgi:hypothetical protein